VALKRGFSESLALGVRAVITLDADGQHDPNEIPLFLERYEQTGADLIIGERDFSRMPVVRRVSNSVGRQAFHGPLVARAGQPIRISVAEPPAHGGAAPEQRTRLRVRDGHDRPMREAGWVVEGVPIATIYGEEKSNIKPMQHVVRFFRMVRSTRGRCVGRKSPGMSGRARVATHAQGEQTAPRNPLAKTRRSGLHDVDQPTLPTRPAARSLIGDRHRGHVRRPWAEGV
jgi:hypothetical protein